MPNLTLVAAVGQANALGWRGAIPWDYPADRAWFKHVTWGCPVIMGARSFASLSAPLLHRRMIVLSRQPSFTTAVPVAASLAEAIKLAQDYLAAPLPVPPSPPPPVGWPVLPPAARIICAGGAQVYDQAWGLASDLWLTRLPYVGVGDCWLTVPSQARLAGAWRLDKMILQHYQLPNNKALPNN